MTDEERLCLQDLAWAHETHATVSQMSEDDRAAHREAALAIRNVVAECDELRRQLEIAGKKIESMIARLPEEISRNLREEQ